MLKSAQGATTLAEVLSVAARQWPDEACIVTEGATCTYRQLNSDTDALADGLLRLGLKRGDKVALLVPNSLEFIVSFFAVFKINAVLVPVNVKYKGEEMRYLLDHSDSAALIIDREFEAIFEPIRASLSGLEQVIWIDRSPSWDRTAGSSGTDGDYSELIRNSPGGASEIAVHPDDESIIFYTSGTTGRPKGAVCTHRSCLAAIDSWVEALQMNRHSRSLMVTPFFHNAFNAFVASLFRVGGSTVIVESFQVKTLLSEITRTRPTLLFATPSVYISMLNAPQVARYDLSSLTTIIYGAAPMPVEVIKALRPVFCNASLYNAYAQSETCPAISYLEPQYALTKAGSVGRGVRSVEIAILDQRNHPAPPDTVGEICVRGENIMKGYYKQPEATEKKIIDGWLHTGDLGYLDEEGFLYLVDRKDDLIITGGENVYPKEIEEVLYAHPDILEGAVIGAPDRTKGSVVVAFIVPKEGKTILSGEIRRFCIARLADFKVPRHVRILGALPRNPSGKVLKAELRSGWEAETKKEGARTKEGEPQ